jgi:hypothetical protein
VRFEIAAGRRRARSLAVLGACLVSAGCGAGSHTVVRGSASRAVDPTPQRHLIARVMRPRLGAVARGTVLGSGAIFTSRVFSNARDGFALANDGNAQYPVRSLDGGKTWRIIGPQFHIDAADGAEGVGYVGVAGRRTLFAYGSSAVDVTTNAGRTWREAFLGELVVAVVPQSSTTLVAYVQQQRNPNRIWPVVTWQYVTRDGGHHWSYTTTLGGLKR